METNGQDTSFRFKDESPKRERIPCPECSSQRVWKDGLRYLNDGRTVQRYLCRSCGFRFSETTTQPIEKLNILKQRRLKILQSGPNLTETPMRDPYFSLKETPDDLTLPLSENVPAHNPSLVTVTGKSLNSLRSHKCNSRVCVSEREAKNLAKVESRTEKRAAGATTPSKADVKGLIVQFKFYMLKENYAESTIERYVKEIKLLVKRGANVLDPESVKQVVARQKWCDNRRAQVYWVYDLFLKMLGKKWDMPRIRVQKKIGFCPTEKTVNQAIAGFGKKISIGIQLIAETGMRPGEMDNLRWDQINFETGKITIIPEKGSNPTVKPVSRELLGRISSLPRVSKKIFGDHQYNTMRTNLGHQRKVLYRKLGNPELLKLTFVSVRHFYATKMYHRYHDLMYVQREMGHKRFQSTLQYVNYEKIIFGDDYRDEWVCKVAKTAEEAASLIEAGFEFVEEIDGKHLYRKPKVRGKCQKYEPRLFFSNCFS